MRFFYLIFAELKKAQPNNWLLSTLLNAITETDLASERNLFNLSELNKYKIYFQTILLNIANILNQNPQNKDLKAVKLPPAIEFLLFYKAKIEVYAYQYDEKIMMIPNILASGDHQQINTNIQNKTTNFEVDTLYEMLAKILKTYNYNVINKIDVKDLVWLINYTASLASDDNTDEIRSTAILALLMRPNVNTYVQLIASHIPWYINQSILTNNPEYIFGSIQDVLNSNTPDAINKLHECYVGTQTAMQWYANVISPNNNNQPPTQQNTANNSFYGQAGLTLYVPENQAYVDQTPESVDANYPYNLDKTNQYN